MAKNKNESNNKNIGTLQDGKPLDSLLEDVIQHAAATS